MESFKAHVRLAFGISEKDLPKLTRYFKPVQYKKGDFLLKANGNCNFLMFVNSGYVRLYTNQKDKEITQWISQENYFLTDLSSFLFHQKARWNMACLTDVEAYKISKSDYAKLQHEFSNWDSIEKAFIAGCFVSLENRIHKLISKNSEERYVDFFEENKTLFNAVPLQYIASMLGMTPETLSRIRAKTIS